MVGRVNYFGTILFFDWCISAQPSQGYYPTGSYASLFSITSCLRGHRVDSTVRGGLVLSVTKGCSCNVRDLGTSYMNESDAADGKDK